MKKSMVTTHPHPVCQRSSISVSEKKISSPMDKPIVEINASPLSISGEKLTIEYGYIRVSSREQNEARQVDAMIDFGITEKHIFISNTGQIPIFDIYW